MPLLPPISYVMYYMEFATQVMIKIQTPFCAMIIVTNHPAFCLNIPQKHRSSRYPAIASQNPSFWIALSARPAQYSTVCHCS